METLFNTSHLVQRDQRCVWHPYTQSSTANLPIPITRAKGAYLYDDQGRQYFDAISSWWIMAHGHAHPAIATRIAHQVQHLEQVVFADFTHIGAVELAERLLDLLHMPQGRVFYSDNGSTAVETALKMALQFWHQTSSKKARTKVICFEKAYHGDTFGAMSAAGRTSFNRAFWPYLFEVQTIPTPQIGNEERSINQLKHLLAADDVACFIFEPLLQGAAGMLTHSKEGLDTLLALCQQQHVLTIADEVMTGFGRTGPLFACDVLKAKPDITCLSKSLTGGFLPLGATVCSEEIFERFVSDNPHHTFLHGHTFCANALACAAALASLDLFVQPACAQQRWAIEQQHRVFQTQWQHHPRLVRCEVIGTILVVEYRDGPQTQAAYFSPLKERLKSYFLKHHIYVRPLGNVLYLMPPYCASSSDLAECYACIINSLSEVI